ncbi:MULTISPECIES: ROK family protein [unclassified Cytobacillus]|uniref:ROK family protein n=1 Tax=unclassified Cytobacillus TaxID=2675268 RepID=UPI00203CD5A3|nr:ROK family protein [Cytobacillus sp. AMY 15.2]MCM3090947.1 ROK family protein [Cytobacillus sp. AMY 15.2]
MQLGVIDIGGTSIKYGIASDAGELFSLDSIPAEAYKGGPLIVEKVKMICDMLLKQARVEGIAISSAGQIDNQNGTVVHATDNIPGYTGTGLAEVISKHTGLPVTVENDVNCTALGEYWQGAAKDMDDFLCVTIGTGIGGALFLNGKLYTGANFSAGEIGHINLYPNGKPCTCGNNGCYERYASSSALSELVEERMGVNLPLEKFFELAREGSKEANNLFVQWADDVATGIQSLVHIFNPELVLIGGGISAQGDFLLEEIQSSLAKKVMQNHWKSLRMRIAAHENKANLLGAAKHFLDMNRKS